MFYYAKNNLTKKRYSACIALDIIGSENKDNQNEHYSFLKVIEEKLNDKFKKYIVVPFQIRGGDELVGVLNSFGEGYRAIHELWLLAIEHHIKVRIGLGFGKYDTLDTINPNSINGSSVISAFRARDKFLKSDKDNPYSLSGPIQVYSYANDLDVPYNSVNALIYTMYELIKTDKQQTLVWNLQCYPDFSYEQIAERIEFLKNDTNNNRSNISKMLKRMKYKTFQQMKIDIAGLLNSYQLLLDEEWKKYYE